MLRLNASARHSADANRWRRPGGAFSGRSCAARAVAAVGQTRGSGRSPRDWIKQQWKREKLNKSVQLTISGCVGPCDLANVVCVISPGGMQWFGGLQEQRHYHLLLDWAKASRDAGVLLELPAELNRHRFERFAPGCGSLAERAVSLIHKGLWQRALRFGAL